MSDEPMILVCSPTTEKAWLPSITGTCASCGQEIWLSARMQNDPKVRAMITWCVPCALKEAAAKGEPFEGIVHPIAVAEVAEYMKGEKDEGPVQ